MKRRPSIVDSTKSSSHPLVPGRYYTAKVTSVLSNGKISVSIPEIGSKFGPVVPLNLNKSFQYSVGDKVKCTFNNEFFDELIILGLATSRSSSSSDEITELKQTVEALKSRIEALELGLWT